MSLELLLEGGIMEIKKLCEECLNEIGCSDNEIFVFLEYINNGNIERTFKLLSKFRYRLLDSIHGEQKKLDCLDYLRHELKKEGEKIKNGY